MLKWTKSFSGFIQNFIFRVFSPWNIDPGFTARTVVSKAGIAHRHEMIFMIAFRAVNKILSFFTVNTKLSIKLILALLVCSPGILANAQEIGNYPHNNLGQSISVNFHLVSPFVTGFYFSLGFLLGLVLVMAVVGFIANVIDKS
jgi:hypothetical protein